MLFTEKILNLNYEDYVRNKQKKIPAVRIDHLLDKYEKIVLFPEKLAKANVRFQKSGFPNLGKKHGS